MAGPNKIRPEDGDLLDLGEYEDLCGNSHVIRHSLAIALTRQEQKRQGDEQKVLWTKFDDFRDEVRGEIANSRAEIKAEIRPVSKALLGDPERQVPGLVSVVAEQQKSIKGLTWKVTLAIGALVLLLKGAPFGVEELLKLIGVGP